MTIRFFDKVGFALAGAIALCNDHGPVTLGAGLSLQGRGPQGGGGSKHRLGAQAATQKTSRGINKKSVATVGTFAAVAATHGGLALADKIASSSGHLTGMLGALRKEMSDLQAQTTLGSDLDKKFKDLDKKVKTFSEEKAKVKKLEAEVKNMEAEIKNMKGDFYCEAKGKCTSGTMAWTELGAHLHKSGAQLKSMPGTTKEVWEANLKNVFDVDGKCTEWPPHTGIPAGYACWDAADLKCFTEKMAPHIDTIFANNADAIAKLADWESCVQKVMCNTNTGCLKVAENVKTAVEAVCRKRDKDDFCVNEVGGLWKVGWYADGREACAIRNEDACRKAFEKTGMGTWHEHYCSFWVEKDTCESSGDTWGKDAYDNELCVISTKASCDAAMGLWKVGVCEGGPPHRARHRCDATIDLYWEY